MIQLNQCWFFSWSFFQESNEDCLIGLNWETNEANYYTIAQVTNLNKFSNPRSKCQFSLKVVYISFNVSCEDIGVTSRQYPLSWWFCFTLIACLMDNVLMSYGGKYILIIINVPNRTVWEWLTYNQSKSQGALVMFFSDIQPLSPPPSKLDVEGRRGRMRGMFLGYWYGPEVCPTTNFMAIYGHIYVIYNHKLVFRVTPLRRIVLYCFGQWLCNNKAVCLFVFWFV